MSPYRFHRAFPWAVINVLFSTAARTCTLAGAGGLSVSTRSTFRDATFVSTSAFFAGKISSAFRSSVMAGQYRRRSATTKSDSALEFAWDRGLNPRWAFIHATYAFGADKASAGYPKLLGTRLTSRIPILLCAQFSNSWLLIEIHRTRCRRHVAANCVLLSHCAGI